MLATLVLAAAAGSCASQPEFEPAGRALFNGPARDASVIRWGPEESGSTGVILSGGGAVMIIPADSPERLVQLEGIPLGTGNVGTNVWVAVEGVGLTGIDISDIDGPKSWTAVEIGDIRSLAVMGRFVAVSGDESGLRLFDAGATRYGEAPRLIQRLEDTAAGTRLSPAGMLLTAAAGSKVLLFEFTPDAMKLEKAAVIEVPAAIKKVGASVWRTLHILTADGEVLRYDVTDLREPKELSPLPEMNVSDFCLRREGGLAFLDSGKIVPFSLPHSVDGSGNPLSQGPRYSLMLGEGMTRSPSFPGSSVRCLEEGFLTFGADAGFSFFEYDGGYVRAIRHIPSNGISIDVTVDGEHIYVANGKDGLRIGRVGEDGSVEWTGRVRTTEARGAAIEGDILALADGKGGAGFYDISDPDSPVLLSRFESPSYLSAVRVRSGRAYFAGGFGGVEVVDFTEPGSPRLVWREKLSEVRGLDVDDRYLYVANGFEGFRIYSTGGDTPRFISEMDTPGWASGLQVSGDLLYVADGQRGFLVADVRERSAPAQLGRIETGAIARSLCAKGDVVFIADQALGVTAVDVSDPRRPAIAARYDTVDDARGVAADGRFVYLASSSGGLYILRYRK
jgi:hypothetical protein